MRKIIICNIILIFFMQSGNAFAKHANEPYCFDCMHNTKLVKKLIKIFMILYLICKTTIYQN